MATLVCDQCGLSFERRRHPGAGRLVFCKKACANAARRSGGVLSVKMRAATFERHGVHSIFEDRARVRQAMLEHHGVENPSQLPDVRRRAEETMLQRYGARTTLESPELREKVTATNVARYGCTNPFAAQTVKDKIVETCLERYGTKSPAQSDIIQERVAATCFDRYGVQHAWQASIVKEKIERTMLERHGVRNALCAGSLRDQQDRSLAKERCHETFKRNGVYARQQSHSEDLFFAALVDVLGHDDVERHALVNGWDLDFKIRSCNAYVQFDGVYWHGLDRPIELIRQSVQPRDVAISATWHRDRLQDEWFKNNGKVLLRVSDRELKEWQRENKVQEMIRKLLSVLETMTSPAS